MTKKRSVARKIVRHKKLGPMQDLLLKACPADPVTGEVSLAILASYLRLSRQTPYTWIAEGRFSPAIARKLVELSDGRITIEDTHRFVFAE